MKDPSMWGPGNLRDDYTIKDQLVLRGCKLTDIDELMNYVPGQPVAADAPE